MVAPYNHEIRGTKAKRLIIDEIETELSALTDADYDRISPVDNLKHKIPSSAHLAQGALPLNNPCEGALPLSTPRERTPSSSTSCEGALPLSTPRSRALPSRLPPRTGGPAQGASRERKGATASNFDEYYNAAGKRRRWNRE